MQNLGLFCKQVNAYTSSILALFIIKVISQYQYIWHFLFSWLGTMDKNEKNEICDRCGKTPNDFKSIKIFHMHLKDNNEIQSVKLLSVKLLKAVNLE